MENIKELQIEKWFDNRHIKDLKGRYITFNKIEPLLKNLTSFYNVKMIGRSFLKTPVYSVSAGKGKIKILLWSQMHGNETSGTKALFDFFHFFEDPGRFKAVVHKILEECELVFIPMLNPDGAKAYTRENAQKIDLNRDAVDLKSPESRILKAVLDEFNPDYCFNLHDQRDIFTAGSGGKTATISFLAPSEGEDRAVTEGRKETMRVIVSMDELLKQYIPGKIGRYTDEFYPTATGDNFQKNGYYTILIESGHYKGDYQREISRMYTFISILQGLYSIASGLNNVDYKEYFEIPENKKDYFDLIFKEINLEGKIVDAGILFKGVVDNETLKLIPEIEKTGNLKGYQADIIVKKEGLSFIDHSELVSYIKIYIDNL